MLYKKSWVLKKRNRYIINNFGDDGGDNNTTEHLKRHLEKTALISFYTLKWVQRKTKRPKCCHIPKYFNYN